MPRWDSLTSVERRALIGAVVLGWIVRLLYVVDSRGHELVGDEPAYHSSAILQTQGKWLWSEAPYGIPHESMWKAPGYQVWAGLWYEVLGVSPDRLFAAQAIVLAPLVIVLSFVLARRLFGGNAAIATALIIAVYPFVWQYEVRLYSESLALPIALVTFLLAFTVPPTRRVVVACGLLVGLALLVRPTGFIVVPAMAVCWIAATGWRAGLLRTAAVIAIAAVVITPLALRNHSVDPDHFVPISVQDAAAYGTFNDDAAGDEERPYKWRPFVKRDADLFAPENPLSDGALRAELRERTWDYIQDHPDSVPKAFFHNGLVRLWDLDPPGQTVDDSKFLGTSRTLTAIGLGMYWLMLPFALAGAALLWRSGRRRIVIGVVASGLAASIVYTSDSSTRYRVPFEPLIVCLACGGASGLIGRRTRAEPPKPPPVAAA